MKILRNPFAAQLPTEEDKCASCKRAFRNDDIFLNGKNAAKLLSNFEMFKDCLKGRSKLFLHMEPCANELRRNIPEEEAKPRIAISKHDLVAFAANSLPAVGAVAIICADMAAYLVNPVLFLILICANPFVGIKIADFYFDK